MEKLFDVCVYGAGHMGRNLVLKATAKQIQGQDEHAWWNGIFDVAKRLPIGNAAGYSIKHLEIMPLVPSATIGGRTHHTVVVEGTGQPLAHTSAVGPRKRKVLATVFAGAGEIDPTVLHAGNGQEASP